MEGYVMCGEWWRDGGVCDGCRMVDGNFAVVNRFLLNSMNRSFTIPLGV